MSVDLLRDAVALVIDDSEDNRFFLRRWLERAGMRVLEAPTGAAGLDLAQKHPDVVIADVRLPDMSGLEVTARIKDNPLTQDVPVIQRSSVAVAEDQQVDGLEAGADAYLIEPIDRDVLIATVTAQLRQRELSRQLELALSLDVSGVYDWSVPTGDVRWTTSLERIYRMEPGSFGGTFEDFVATVHPDDRAHVGEVLDAALRATDSLEVSFRFLRADGTHGWIESRGRVFRDADGAPVRVLGLAHDVTDRVVDRQRVEQLRRLASEFTGARTSQRVIEVLDGELAQSTIGVRLVEDDAPAGDDVIFSYATGSVRLDLVEDAVGDDVVTRRQATAIGELAGTALDRALRFEAERSNAVALQRALLPAAIPDVDRWWIDARYEPAEEDDRLGGDFFDVIEVDDAFVVVVGDVAGHGLDATRQMGTVRTLLRTLAASHDGDPVTVLHRARMLFARVCGAGTPFVSAVVARCRADGEVTIASAGHPPPIVRRDGEVALVPLGPGPPLGTFAAASDRSCSLRIGGGDWIAFYTDGVFERRDRTLDETIADVRDALARVATADDLIAAGADAGGASHRDDRAVVVARRLTDR